MPSTKTEKTAGGPEANTCKRLSSMWPGRGKSTATAAEERFGCTVRAYLEFAVAHPGAWRLLSATRANEHPAVLQAREQRMVELADAWGGTTEARIVAYALVGMLEAATLDWLRASDEVQLDSVADILLDLIWRGMPGLAEHGIVAG